MKIVLLVSALNAGGAERVATTLCNAWAERGGQVSLVATYSGGGQPFYEVSPRVNLVVLADLVKSARGATRSYPFRLLTLRRLLLEDRPDVVVSFLPNVNVAAILAMGFSKVPLIICERNDPSERHPLDPWEIASKVLFRFADMMTVQTNAVAEKIGNIYPKLAKVRVVPNPLSGAFIGPADSAPRERRIVLSIGRLVAQKRVDRIILAFAGVHRQFPDWDLHIYGDGVLKESLLMLITSLNLQGRVLLKGLAADSAGVMRNADVFVMASSHEGFPNTLLEAMGSGLACIATDCPSGPKEISRDGADALLVPLHDEAALVNALCEVMADAGLRLDLGARARESVSARFSLERVLERWDDLFGEVVHSAAAMPRTKAAGAVIQYANRSEK